MHHGRTVFFTCVGAPDQLPRARMLIDSVRSFGGELSGCPFWVMELDREAAPCGGLMAEGVAVHPVRVPDALRGYLFSGKVAACARAEELARDSVDTLVWVIPECLIVRPPSLMKLDRATDVAVRPVHIRNVGLPAGQQPDVFWRGVFELTGVPDPEFTVRSFVEGVLIRPYFNSAAFALTPSLGLMGRWLSLFAEAVTDAAFQAEACGDELHRVFLHQAVLSSLIATSVDGGSLRLLPPEYGYPYNLHDRVPSERRAAALNDLVLPIYEHRTVNPARVTDIEIREPLRSWLEERSEAAGD